MLHHSQDTHADPAAALLCYLLSSRMADAKSPAATWSAAREHFCSQRCVGVTPGLGATNWLSSPGAVLASATISGGKSRSCMGTTHTQAHVTEHLLYLHKVRAEHHWCACCRYVSDTGLAERTHGISAMQVRARGHASHLIKGKGQMPFMCRHGNSPPCPSRLLHLLLHWPQPPQSPPSPRPALLWGPQV